jgi:glutamate racemase
VSDNTRPIGIFDSGIGGATVLRQLRSLLPAETLCYVADQAYCPYGQRLPAEIRARSRLIARWLIDAGAKAIVVACNTASAVALAPLREEFSQIPFIGMVPAVKPAALSTRSGVIGVLATPATIGGDLLREVVERWAPGVRVLAQACPGLVEQVERGELDAPLTRALLSSYIRPLLEAGADALVLGCTHYPFLIDAMRATAGPGVALLDPAPAVARQVQRVLAQAGLLCAGRDLGAVYYHTSAGCDAMAALVWRLDLPGGAVRQLDLPPAAL